MPEKPPTPEQQAYEALQYYTLSLADARFLHQHVVDAWSAQNATIDGKSIALTFALIGLYLHVERGKRKHQWPRFSLPGVRGGFTAADVMAQPPTGARASGRA
jgi:hypothetical protein